MKLLLDTHALIWAAAAPDRLSERAVAAITADDAEVFASHVSLWEMAIKRRLGNLDLLDRPAIAWFDAFVTPAGIRHLAIEATPLGAVESLPPLHGDPFDRLLVTQAQHGTMTIVTRDELVTQYDVATLW